MGHTWGILCSLDQHFLLKYIDKSEYRQAHCQYLLSKGVTTLNLYDGQCVHCKCVSFQIKALNAEAF